MYYSYLLFFPNLISIPLINLFFQSFFLLLQFFRDLETSINTSLSIFVFLFLEPFHGTNYKLYISILLNIDILKLRALKHNI
jgi:hypothetical protein